MHIRLHNAMFYLPHGFLKWHLQMISAGSRVIPYNVYLTAEKMTIAQMISISHTCSSTSSSYLILITKVTKYLKTSTKPPLYRKFIKTTNPQTPRTKTRYMQILLKWQYKLIIKTSNEKHQKWHITYALLSHMQVQCSIFITMTL